MLCPTCHVELRITDRQGVEIDYCPQCRGIWLDRGELDKIIERSGTFEQRSSNRDRDEERYSDDSRREYKPKRKRDSFLSELFDFDQPRAGLPIHGRPFPSLIASQPSVAEGGSSGASPRPPNSPSRLLTRRKMGFR